METKDRQIKTMAKIVLGRKQEEIINRDVGKKLLSGRNTGKDDSALLDEASMGNMNEYEILFLPC